VRTRGLYLVLVALALAGVASLCFHLNSPKPPRSGITRENAARIQPGMTTDDAETIIGFPPQVEFGSQHLDHSPANAFSVLMWSDTECDILVYLDREKKVVQVRTMPDR
jgi:hypothetical protein